MDSGSGSVGGFAAAAAPLIERERELGLFERLLSAAREDVSALVVIEGPAGIGKTRLVIALRDRALAEGMQVLTAFGSDLEREFPFGVVRQLFEPLLSHEQQRDRLFAGAAAPAQSVFGAVEGGHAQGDASFAALHGLYWLTVNAAADRPLMIVVDDLHWCDRPSLRFLAYMARRLEGLGIVLVVGLRSAEPGTDPVMIGELVSAADALHVHPGPLSDAGIAELVRSRLGAEPEAEFVAACQAATGGNPLLLRQLLSSLEADGVLPDRAHVRSVEQVGPRAVSRTVLLRLRRLASPATSVAQAVAILGNNAELPLIARLCELQEADVASATAELARAEILRPDPPLRFVHPLVRDAIYHELPSVERELLHAAAAGALLDARAAPEAVATQLLAAPRRGEPWVVELLREAAREAQGKGAADSAVAYLERALAEPPAEGERTQVVLELGLAETLTSGPAATTHLREGWEALEDPRERAHVAATLARTLLFTAPAQEAVEVAEQALAETPEELTDERQALHAFALMAVFFGSQKQGEMARLRQIEISGDGPGAKMLTAIKAFCLAVTGASAEECVPLALEALADGVLIEADPGLFPPAAISVLFLADRDEALQAWDRLRERAYREGSLLGILTLGLWRGVTLMWRGDLREAEESLTQAIEDFVSWGLIAAGETYGPAFLGAVRLRRGDVASARELLDPAQLPDPGTDGYRHLLRFWCEALLAEGRHEQALEVAEDLSRRLTFVRLPGWAPWRSLKAEALDGLGRTREAIELAEQELAHARDFGTPGAVGQALCLLGRLEREAGVAHLEEGVALLERSTARYELARGLLALGGALRRERRPSEAREPLRRALELADRCGAERLVEQARAELHATGARPRVSALEGVDSLTASERRVVDLAVAGNTNKEIAQTLYVTPKTVEVHLSSAYRKLSIRSRHDLARALAA